MIKINPVKPPTYYYHYSSEASQGALVCQTKDFPAGYNPETEKFFCAYSDRIHSWDAERYKKACELAGTGCQGWAYELPKLSDKKLKEFVQAALNLPIKPKHVRIVHWFNVSNGYSCPTVEAVYKKITK